MNIKATKLSPNTYCLQVADCTAYGTYDAQGFGALDHAPTQPEMDTVAAAIDALSSDELADLIQKA